MDSALGSYSVVPGTNPANYHLIDRPLFSGMEWDGAKLPWDGAKLPWDGAKLPWDGAKQGCLLKADRGDTKSKTSLIFPANVPVDNLTCFSNGRSRLKIAITLIKACHTLKTLI
jgi:hypothetical protein